MGTALLSAIESSLQEIPALQHFLRAPRGCETLPEEPDAVPVPAQPGSHGIAPAELPSGITARAETQQR